MPEYITHIDQANSAVNALERQLGIAQSEFIENLDTVNARLQELSTKASAPKAAPVASTGELETLNARCKHLANCVGFQEYGNYTTVAAAKDRITELERRLGQQAKAHEEKTKPTPAQPKPLPNGLAAIEKSGKVHGLAKAMIAAQRNHQEAQGK